MVFWKHDVGQHISKISSFLAGTCATAKVPVRMNSMGVSLQLRRDR